MPEYPRLPEVAAPAADESLTAYAVRVLAFVARTGVTATLSDRDLALADHCYPIAIGHPEILPVAVDTLSRARHQILATIKYRAASATPAAVDVPRAQPARSIPGGQLTPLQPAPIVRPPASGYAIATPTRPAPAVVDLGF